MLAISDYLNVMRKGGGRADWWAGESCWWEGLLRGVKKEITFLLTILAWKWKIPVVVRLKKNRMMGGRGGRGGVACQEKRLQQSQGDVDGSQKDTEAAPPERLLPPRHRCPRTTVCSVENYSS